MRIARSAVVGAGVALLLALYVRARPERDGWWGVAFGAALAAVVLAVVAIVRSRATAPLRAALTVALLTAAGLVVGLVSIGGPTDTGPLGRPLRRRRRTVLPDLAGTPARPAWAEAARGEHASVPAFARVSLDLAAVGAPLDLHERVHRAAIEEVDHARRALALAGPGVTTGALPGRARTLKLARIAVETFHDGCVGEGDAAATAAATTGASAAEREALEVIARDEAGHAELAWAILAWCVEAGGPPVAAVVRRELRKVRDRPDVVARGRALVG